MAFTHLDERQFSPLVETSAQIQRTMVVGLGGTGAEIIKRLKRRLGRQGQASTYIRFLSLDTDVRSWLATLQFPAIEPRERVPLYYATPENVFESPHLYPTIQHLFHQGKKVDISLLANANGAGLMPVVGRAAFHLNAPHIYQALQRGLRDLQAIPFQPGGQPLTDEYRVYVVGSTAGGTGAGCFLEMAVLIRHVFQSFKHQLIGVLALPEAFAPTLRGQQLDAQSRGNAYAVLKELQYLQDGPVHWHDPDTYTFQFALGNEVRTLTLNEKPFNILYLIDNQNQSGGALRNLTDIYEMASQQLSVEIGSPFGSKFHSAQANDRAIMGLAPCPETGRPANISSLATAALVIPEEKLVRYCGRRYLKEVARDRMLGAMPQLREEQRAAEAWLMAAGLDERGGHRMISRALLTDPKEERELTGPEYALDPEALSERTVTDFLTALGHQEEHFMAQALPAVRAMVDRNLERLKSELPERIAGMMKELLASRGARTALARRAALAHELEAMAAELARLQHDAEALREEAASRLEAEREALARKAGLLGGLFGKRREQMRLVASLQGDLMQLDLDMVGRAATLRLIESAGAVLEEHRRSLEALESYLVRILANAEAELTQEQWSSDTGSAYALETEVIRPDHYRTYFDRFRPASPEDFLTSIGDLSGREYSDVAATLQKAVRELFRERVQQLNVVSVLQELYSKTEAFDLLDDLARRCQPFWTASPRGAGAFSDVFLIGSPGVREAAGQPVKAEPLLQDWVDQHAGGGGAGLQSSPTYVALGTPGAIIFSRQTHGARLHYMRQILDYQEHYRSLQQQKGYPVHFKPCHEALPELRPDDEKATEAWALGVAYGMVAAKTFGWVWALDTEQRKDGEMPGGFRTTEVLRTGSLWDLAAEIVPVEARDFPQHSSRFLHMTRSGALGQFSQRRDAVAAVERLVGRRLDAIGKQSLGAELTRYLEEVLHPRLKRVEEMEAATLTKEYNAIRKWVERLNL